MSLLSRIRLMFENSDQIQLEVETSDWTEIHKLRQKILQEIPTFRIDSVEILANDTFVYDEMIAHRLTLIPFQSGDLTLEPNLELDCLGPGSVFSQDLKGKVAPTSKEILIVKLTANQRLHIKAKLKVNCGKDDSNNFPILQFNYKRIRESLYRVEIETTGALTWEQISQNLV